MIRTFKYPLRPTQAQAAVMALWLLRCRQLYNAALEERSGAWKKQRVSINRRDQQKSLTLIRAEHPEFREVPAVVLRSALARMQFAFENFFRRCKLGEKPGYPRFKGRDRFNSFGLDNQIPMIKHSPGKGQLSKVFLPKLGPVSFKEYRPIQGKVLDIKVKRDGDKWWIYFQCDLGPKPVQAVAPARAIGIDLGLTHFLTTSEGETVPNPRFFRASEELIARRQRALQRKKRGSNSRYKAKLSLIKAYAKVRNQRTDFARKLAKELLERFDLVVHEDLQVSNMARSNLAKSISDVSWGQFIQCLKSKAEEAGKSVIGVNPRGTSQRCSGCGEVVRKALSERTHSCPHCGLSMDRDHNAALNILRLGPSLNPVLPSGSQTKALGGLV